MTREADDAYGWRTSFYVPVDPEALSQAALSIEDPWSGEETSEEAAPQRRYQKISIIGEGGMGRVWLGRDTHLDRSVAIKEPLAGPQEARRLIREARHCAKLDHGGVVAIYDVYEEGAAPHFVMALVRGRTLAAHLAEASEGSRSPLVRHVLEVCDAIGHAHRHGIVHRDITPRNIVIDEDGAARVIDWGLAVPTGEGGAGRAGTLGYVAPEQDRGEVPTPQADVWSLGALLHTVLCGAPPGRGSLPTRLDPELRAIIDCATAADPQRRYADAARMGADLRRWFEGRPVEAVQLTPWTLVRRLVRVYRLQLSVATLVLVAVAAALSYGLWTTARESERARAAEDVATQRAAEMLRRDAAIALRSGDLHRARASAGESLKTSPTAMARGIWMQTERILPPERLERIELPPCPGWILGLDNDFIPCRVKDDQLQIWRGKELLWERQGLVTSVRIEGEELHVLNNFRELTVHDVRTGAVLREDPRPGEFATRMDGVDRLSIDQREWFEGEPLPEACPAGLGQAHLWDGVYWMICLSGEVFSGPSGALQSISGAATADLPIVLARAAGRVFGGTRGGIIQAIDGQSMRLDLEESLEILQAIPGTDFLLAIGGASAVRVLDARRGEWIASFPRDVQEAHVTHEGIWLLRDDMSLEKWRIPSQPIWHYRTRHGYSSLSWSLDGARLGATDGGGNFHLIEPDTGRTYAPIQIANRVAKDVAVSSLDEEFRVLTMDALGLWRVSIDGEHLRPELEPLHKESTTAIGYLDDGSPYFVGYVGGFYYYSPNGRVNIRTDGPILTALGLHPNGHKGLLLGKEGSVWLFERDAESVKLPWPPARQVAMAEDDRAAVVDAEGNLRVYGPKGELASVWPLPPSPAISLTWRRNSPALITGHLDGAIRIYTDTGELLAELHHHTGRISKVASSPDGRLLAATSWDATLSISSLEALDALLKQGL